MRKYIFVFLLVVIISASFNFEIKTNSVYAMGNTTIPNAEELRGTREFYLPESTISEVKFMFSNKDDYEIIDSKGNDISKEFFERNEENYVNGSFSVIVRELTKENLIAIQYKNVVGTELNQD